MWLGRILRKPIGPCGTIRHLRDVEHPTIIVELLEILHCGRRSNAVPGLDAILDGLEHMGDRGCSCQRGIRLVGKGDTEDILQRVVDILEQPPLFLQGGR